MVFTCQFTRVTPPTWRTSILSLIFNKRDVGCNQRIPPSLVALQLQKESQELEIKKLELQLQLAKLQGGQIASPTSTESSPGNHSAT